MLKRILIINGILIVGIASFSLLNKDEPEPLSTKERELQFSTLNTVTEKNYDKYGDLEFTVSSNSEIE